MKRPLGHRIRVLPNDAAHEIQAEHEGILAVVGGAHDEAVLDLALVLAAREDQPIYVVQLVEAPIALPMAAYGRFLLDQDGDGPLDAAVRLGGARIADAALVICRSIGPALVAEAAERGCRDLVLGAPLGGWRVRRRQERAVAHLRARAGCRVFIIHTPPAPIAEPAAALAR